MTVPRKLIKSSDYAIYLDVKKDCREFCVQFHERTLFSGRLEPVVGDYWFWKIDCISTKYSQPLLL